MGHSMCQHLLSAGYRVTAYNRTRSKAESLQGAEIVDTPAAVASQSDVIFTIVGYPHDVRSVYLSDDGILANAAEGSIVVDMTTSQPGLAIEIHEAAARKSIAAIDAPVSGGDVGARNGTLSIMIGGDRETVDRMQPIFDILGKTIVYQGPAGSGQHTKMVNQTLIATNMIGVCEALIYAWKAGLDLETVLKSVGSGAAGSWSLSNLGPRIIANDFEPGFFVEHFIKDMGIALEEARRMDLSMPGLAMAYQLYVALAAQGGKRNGTQALQIALAKMSNIDWENREV